MRLETNGNSREVSKVIVERNGAREEYSGDIVVVVRCSELRRIVAQIGK